MIVTFIGYKFVLKNPAPLFDDTFHIPTRRDIDKPLIIGGVLFGAGWGLVGYCPGPAIAGISYGYLATLTFIPAMIVGLLLAKPLGKIFKP